MESARKLLAVLGCWEGDSQLTTPHGHTQKISQQYKQALMGEGSRRRKVVREGMEGESGRIWGKEGEYDSRVSKNHKHKNINITSQTTS